MLPPFPSEQEVDANGSRWPFPEGYQWEFKENISSLTAHTAPTKVMNTICAFLNNAGGYIVIGIRDSDQAVVGVKNADRIDNFLLTIDNIFHNRAIMKDDGTAVDVSSVVGYTRLFCGKRIVIIKCTPQPGCRYMDRDSRVWIRLSASNYSRMDSERFYSPTDYENMKKQFIQKMRQVNDETDAQFRKEIETGAAKLAAATSRAAAVESLLYKKILAEKAAAEEAITESRCFPVKVMSFITSLLLPAHTDSTPSWKKQSVLPSYSATYADLCCLL